MGHANKKRKVCKKLYVVQVHTVIILTGDHGGLPQTGRALGTE